MLIGSLLFIFTVGKQTISSFSATHLFIKQQKVIVHQPSPILVIIILELFQTPLSLVLSYLVREKQNESPLQLFPTIFFHNTTTISQSRARFQRDRVYLQVVTRWWRKMEISSLESSKPGQSLCPPPNGVNVLLVTAIPTFCQAKRQLEF